VCVEADRQAIQFGVAELPIIDVEGVTTLAPSFVVAHQRMQGQPQSQLQLPNASPLIAHAVFVSVTIPYLLNEPIGSLHLRHRLHFFAAEAAIHPPISIAWESFIIIGRASGTKITSVP
jgi:hypothetical protein